MELNNCEIEDLQEAVTRQHGFTIETHKLEAYGLCATSQPPHPGLIVFHFS